MLTGRYPDESIDESYELDAPLVSELLPDDVRSAGFHSNPFVSRAYGYDVGFDEFDDDLYFGQNKVVALAQRLWDKVRNHHYARADTINERSLDWLDSLEDDEDVFLWNHYMDVHGPYEAPKQYRSEFGVGHISARDARKLYKKALRNPDEMTDQDTQDLRNLYDAEIRYVDHHIGAFVQELCDRGVLEETLLLITADHGDAFGEHDYFEHPRRLHEELISVPMIVVGSDLPAKTVDVTASTVDLVPSILSCLGTNDDGASAENELSGLPLQSVWDGERSSDARKVFSLARGHSDESHLRRFSLHNGVEQARAEKDMRTDKVTMLADAPDHLERDLNEFVRNRDGQVDDTDRSGDVSENETVNDRLQALGYKK
jgi:arylsulfatase